MSKTSWSTLTGRLTGRPSLSGRLAELLAEAAVNYLVHLGEEVMEMIMPENDRKQESKQEDVGE